MNLRSSSRSARHLPTPTNSGNGWRRLARVRQACGYRKSLKMLALTNQPWQTMHLMCRC